MEIDFPLLAWFPFLTWTSLFLTLAATRYGYLNDTWFCSTDKLLLLWAGWLVIFCLRDGETEAMNSNSIHMHQNILHLEYFLFLFLFVLVCLLLNTFSLGIFYWMPLFLVYNNLMNIPFWYLYSLDLDLD